MERGYFAVIWCFGERWFEAWAPDVIGATVIAPSEEEAVDELQEQLTACLSSCDGGHLPAPSSRQAAEAKADALLRECDPGDYPSPVAKRVEFIRPGLLKGDRLEHLPSSTQVRCMPTASV
ncbi:hypothetical protein PLESTB_001055000 [Pleodorina starrii]|uniref:Uncharacterized protein n=1 Tax=Pleodorina starrii TaxID=330485 RepID=A0A9W6F540_9CHLO|nr:hypothetical protein PLESTM_001273300 [Pleodorina starrii]GLC56011.1 hypothetical protein PLESTB_001055000 [Pleodorina starrii]GLC63998.1 hypothetical protein PLESTF_000107500 [Pleodorina starrii]